MLSRKVSGSGLISATAGIDRGRVGERLQAALAGLQELHFLKEKQYDMVNWALQMDREEPACSIQTCTDDSRRGKARLEATLTALKQQLSRLRRQDVGLKTHLQQLDQQIIELKMDVCKASTEQLESDSRPSSGFYDLSDGGSCSLSNSYTSVYSECLSSCSQTSLLPPSCSSGPRTLSVSMQAEASRRRSADETTTQPNPPRGTGLHLGSSRIRTGTTGTERARQRPVSTGDLDRMMTPGLGFYKSVDVKKSSLCCNLKSTTVDPKYQSNLVSRGGAEVYHYPSPLHAVALQSPIFSLGIEPIVPAVPEGQGPADGVLSVDILQRGRKGTEAKPLGYIDKLLQHSMGKINIQSEAGKDTVQMRPDDHSEASAVGAVCQEVPLVQVHTQQPAMLTDINPADRKRLSVVYSSQGQVNYCNPTQALRAPETSYRYSYPAALREFSPSEVHTTTGRVKPLAEDVREQAHPDLGCMEIQGWVTDRKASDRRPGGAVSSSTEEGQDKVGSLACALSPDFVHAKFVPAGSQCVKVRQDRKTKAVRLRRRSSEKHRGMTLQQGHSSSDRTREASSSARGERELRVSGKARASQRLVSSLGEERWHSGSESSLCGLSLSYAPMFHAQPQPISASKSSKTCRPQYLDQEQHTDQRKRRQGTTKWLSDMETFQAMCVQGQGSREPQTQAAVSRSATVRSLNARPKSGQWGGPLCALQPSFYTSSYFSNINARYPPAPFPLSTHYPSRCESEYSADCASLFHSTIAESSEGELSDNTINRFGDSETSQSSKSPSDSDSSLSLDEGDQVESYEKVGHLVWAEAALGSTATGLPLEQLPRPEPPACRIKASRALKKKIRRFRPASMKVMTLV